MLIYVVVQKIPDSTGVAELHGGSNYGRLCTKGSLLSAINELDISVAEPHAFRDGVKRSDA